MSVIQYIITIIISPDRHDTMHTFTSQHTTQSLLLMLDLPLNKCVEFWLSQDLMHSDLIKYVFSLLT